MQLASSRVWTRIAASISYDNNHYITGTSNNTGTLVYVEYPFIGINPGSFRPVVIAPDRVLPKGQIELFDI